MTSDEGHQSSSNVTSRATVACICAEGNILTQHVIGCCLNKLPVKCQQFARCSCFRRSGFKTTSSVRKGRKKTETPGELVKSESYIYVWMIKRPAYNIKLIIKGPWADTGLQALLNTHEGELLHSLLESGYDWEDEAKRNRKTRERSRTPSSPHHPRQTR